MRCGKLSKSGAGEVSGFGASHSKPKGRTHGGEASCLRGSYSCKTVRTSDGLTRAAVSWITGPAALMSPVLSPNAYAISGRANQLGTNDGAKLSRATPGRSSLQLHTTTTATPATTSSPCTKLLSSQMF